MNYAFKRDRTLKCFLFCSLHLKEEAHDFLEENTLKELVKKYSQFINFPIYIWASKVCCSIEQRFKPLVITLYPFQM